MNTNPGHETITTSILHQIDARPPGVSRQYWAAYGHRYPGSGKRWLDQRAEREWFAAARPGARICATCKQPYGSKEHHGVRYCSLDCYRSRVRPPRPVPTHQEVVAEITSAYTAFYQAALAC